jgi:hypothetical protein
MKGTDITSPGTKLGSVSVAGGSKLIVGQDTTTLAANINIGSTFSIGTLQFDSNTVNVAIAQGAIVLVLPGSQLLFTGDQDVTGNRITSPPGLGSAWIDNFGTVVRTGEGVFTSDLPILNDVNLLGLKGTIVVKNASGDASTTLAINGFALETQGESIMQRDGLIQLGTPADTGTSTLSVTSGIYLAGGTLSSLGTGYDFLKLNLTPLEIHNTSQVLIGSGGGTYGALYIEGGEVWFRDKFKLVIHLQGGNIAVPPGATAPCNSLEVDGGNLDIGANVVCDVTSDDGAPPPGTTYQIVAVLSSEDSIVGEFTFLWNGVP